MKNPLTLAGIEPATFRFVAQHLNHCATAVTQSKIFSQLQTFKDQTLHANQADLHYGWYFGDQNPNVCKRIG